MEKTTGALMIAMVISVMGIPIAYLAGQRSVEATLETELERTRSEQADLLSEMREQLSEVALKQERIGGAAGPAPSGATAAAHQHVRPANPPAEEVRKDLAIDFATYEAIAIGAAYERVVERLGREGSRTLSIVDQNGTVTEQFVWEWMKPDGSRGKIDLSFLDGTLEDKSYKG